MFSSGLWVLSRFSRFSRFLPQTKNMQFRLIGNSKLPVGVNGCLSPCEPCDWLATCPEPPPPSIRLNSDFLPNQTERVLTAGAAFNLSCHGNGSVRWSVTALLFPYKLPNTLEFPSSKAKNTGTYRCGYTNRSLEHLDTWVHLYVKDPSNVFVTPNRQPPTFKEGEDFLFRCLLTDPSVTNLNLQLKGSAGVLPTGMNVTFDPRQGAQIYRLQTTFKGQYVCSGMKDGRWVESKPVDLLVLPRLPPPRVSVSQQEVVRLTGEQFEVTCWASNPTHSFSVNWTSPNTQVSITSSSQYVRNQFSFNNTLTVASVSLTHSGAYTCTANNGEAVTTATTHLRVLDRPYLKIYLQQHANANTRTMEVNGALVANASSMSMEGERDANISSMSMEGERELVANVSTNRNANISSTSRTEVYEAQDVMLTFGMEAYPPIRSQHWVTPTHVNNTVYQESYTTNGCRSEAMLLLRRVRQVDRGRYSFHFSNSFFSGSMNIDLRIYRSPSVLISLENGSLTCSSSGYPPPSVLWLSCPGLRDTCGDVSTYQVSPTDVTSQEDDDDDEEVVRKHLPLPLSPGDDVTVECVADNFVGRSRKVFVLPSTGEPPTILTPALIGALGAAAFLLLLLLVVSYKWRQKPKYEIRWKIIESSDGNNYTFVDPTQLPYNYKWEFPRDKLRLGAVLGSGAFGKVVEATAYGLGTDDNVTRVAVKMLKPSAHSEEREALMSELKILSHLGYHDNIVNLLGACTRGGPMLMITEYCSHGDLLNFLRGHAHDFMASILSVDEVEGEAFYKNMTAQHARLRSDSGISCCSEYQEMQPILSPGQEHLGVQKDSLSVSDLMRFSYQVAQGLDFLSTRNCIHRDVAARNVLLTDHRVAKICDFGLARDICNDDSYIVQGNARLPVKWMAPESIFQCVYTVQSDVWSYGVLLWEIFSLGKSPYPNVAVDTNFYMMIKDGRHMAQPDFAPAEMYQLMTLCWSLEPTDRPTFKMIGQLIDRLLPASNDTSPHHSKQLTYRNIDECREEEEEEEEEEATMKNIYQLS
ncbi:macrophage colony-stimulating factor 1 receptor 2 [Scomber japonicus]|uniref:macrophage colony-stimulating factor 1 receptor 2 n=1 Tax=Scomber japonicus TaxID=13676 RepID=UPI0023065E6D|nr:macrophage colony-stimulating factor 1 receptor 2 [Scomber japonicus]